MFYIFIQLLYSILLSLICNQSAMFPFILRNFAIKSLYIEKAMQIITTPQNTSQKLVCTSYFIHTTLWYYYPSLFLTYSSPTLSATYFVTCVTSHLAACSLLLYHIKFFTKFSLYYILLFIISSYRLLKKGSTSPCSIILFAGSSHHKHNITDPGNGMSSPHVVVRLCWLLLATWTEHHFTDDIWTGTGSTAIGRWF